MITTNYLRVIKAIIIINDYYEHMYDSADDELNDELNEYKIEGIIKGKYYSLLESVAKIINRYDLDISIVKKSTLNLINSYCRIKSLNKACFSEPEEINKKKKNERSDDELEISDNKSEISDDEHEISDNKTNKKTIITDQEYESDLRIILKQAIKTNDRELMISAMSLLKKFDENKSTDTASTTNTETPNWLRPLICTINPENNK